MEFSAEKMNGLKQQFQKQKKTGNICIAEQRMETSMHCGKCYSFTVVFDLPVGYFLQTYYHFHIFFWGEKKIIQKYSIFALECVTVVINSTIITFEYNNNAYCTLRTTTLTTFHSIFDQFSFAIFIGSVNCSVVII